MKAIVIENKKLFWQNVPNPVLQPGEVLIRVQAAAVNRADLMQAEGNYPPPPGAPPWPGLEVAGEIAALSPEAARESAWREGDAVCALLGGGGYAEFAAVHHTMLMPVPAGVSVIEAAALPEAFATAYLNLVWEGSACPGDTLLMHAGASGLASVIIPLAKAMGLRVITTVLSPKVAEKIAHLPADLVVNTGAENIADVLKTQQEQGFPVNIAIDCLGGADMGACLPYVAFGCRWIMIATLAGDVAKVDLRNVFMKNIRIIGSTLRSKKPEAKAKLLADLVEHVWPLVASGQVRPTIYKVLPMNQAEEAHALLREGKSAGKVVLTLP